LNLLAFSSRIPKMGLIQVEGCAPMVHAWHQNREQAIPVKSPRTLIATLATGDPGQTYTILRKKIKSGSGGNFESVTDEEAYRAMHLLAKMEGLSVEPAAAVAFAGLVKLVRAGVVKHDEVVVINCSGHTMSVDSDVLGEGWEQTINLKAKGMQQNQEEGLLAALNNVSIDKYPRIAIVDDETDVRRLIRRILQSQGNFTLFEADDGRSAISLIKKEHPNLIILDLMMPDIDGFSVMDALQDQADTKDIPIIVVTAKELTSAEKNRLKGHIQSLMQKGDFLNDDLFDEVRSLIK
jgi:threonine synthase